MVVIFVQSIQAAISSQARLLAEAQVRVGGHGPERSCRRPSNTWLPRGPQPGDPQALQAPAVAQGQGEGASLRPEVLVPDHLRERDRHHEAAALDLHPGGRLEAREGQVHAGVARVVVVADEGLGGLAGRRLRVLVLRVVEVAPHSQHELAHSELEPRAGGAGASGPACVVCRGGHEDVPRPLLARQAVHVEAQAVLLVGLVDVVLGAGGRGDEDQAGEGERRASFVAADSTIGRRGPAATGVALRTLLEYTRSRRVRHARAPDRGHHSRRRRRRGHRPRPGRDPARGVRGHRRGQRLARPHGRGGAGGAGRAWCTSRVAATARPAWPGSRPRREPTCSSSSTATTATTRASSWTCWLPSSPGRPTS